MTCLVLVSNRVAVPNDRKARSGGLRVVLSDALAKDALWFGWSGKISEAPQQHEYRGKKFDVSVLDVTAAEYKAYYVGFSNSCMYPLLLYRPDLVKFRAEDYAGYLEVCARFGEALANRIDADDLVWVHDNQLLSIIRHLRKELPGIRAGIFLHLPFPPFDLFSTLPVAREMLGDWLLYDIVGFQTERDKDNFIASCTSLLDCISLPNGCLRREGRVTKLIVNPVGIRASEFERMATRNSKSKEADDLLSSLAGRKLMISAERLDYSKGLMERVNAYGRFLEKYPQARRKISFLQVAPESRKEVEDYQLLKQRLDRAVGDLNGRFSEIDWVPLRYITRSLPRQKLAAYFRCAAIGMVTPLRDGFNLVAEEFLAAQPGSDPGVLILSQFAGAAEYLTGAITVNPYDTEALADAIHTASELPLEERLARWSEMMEFIEARSAKAWLENFVAALRDRSITAGPLATAPVEEPAHDVPLF